MLLKDSKIVVIKKVTSLHKNKQETFNDIANKRNKARSELLKKLNPIIKKYMEEAKEGWEANSDLIPEGSVVFAKVEQDIKDQQKTTGLTDGQKLAKFVLFGMALHSGVVAFFP